MSKVTQIVSGLVFASKKVVIPKLFLGDNSILKLADIIIKKGFKSVFIASSRTVYREGMLDNLIKKFDNSAIKTTIFTDIVNDPTINNVEKGYQLYLKNNCDCILSVGGGSVLDCSKVIGLRVSNPNKSVKIMSSYVVPLKKSAPLFMSPTTSGTGSEVTYYSVITDQRQKRKLALVTDKAMPKYIAYDSNLMSKVPISTTTYAGLDALTHAIESYISQFSRAFYSDTNKALLATKLIFENIESVVNEPENHQVRLKMAKASFYAGISFRRSGVGYIHAFAHRLGELYHIPHGLACAVVMPYILEKSMPDIQTDLSNLGLACGVKGNSHSEIAYGFIEKIRELNKNLGIPNHFSEIKDDDFALILTRIENESAFMGVPVIMNERQLNQILEELQQ